MRFLFIVQGEGRGHLSQALSLQQILSCNGHEVCAAMIGCGRFREIPEFFARRIGAPVCTFRSPTFRLDSKNKGICIFGSFWENILRIPNYVNSLKTIKRFVNYYRPDVIVNFYEPLAAVYTVLHRPRTKSVCIAHQYLMLHPDFEFPKRKWIARAALLFYTWVTSWGTDKRLALSYRKMPDLPQKKLFVVPPLLRSELRQLTTRTQNFILVYVLNDGYANDIANWHSRFADVEILGFWDRKEASAITRLDKKLVFRKLDDVAFLNAMSRCRGFVSTAGFESICEAMYLDKPVYMIPVRHQFEQHCNAVDAHQAGAGIWGFEIDLSGFLEYIPKHRGDPDQFRNWVHMADPIFANLLKAK
jgi:uncharacterized protein (TIGR00661 family)